MLFTHPLPVTDVRDVWDWLAIWCTIGAVAFAALAIWIAVIAIRRGDRNAREAQVAIAQERRNVFELGLLARLVDICGHNEPGSVEVVAGLLRMLPADDLPGLRRENEQGHMVSGPSFHALLGEFNEAVDRRLRNGAWAAPKSRR
jgi:hypothetical protein